MMFNVLSFIMIGMLIALFSNQIVVCDVDPSDVNSILLEQLKVQREQLALDKMIQIKQSKQLETQQEQLKILTEFAENYQHRTIATEVIAYVLCTAFGFVALEFLRRLLKYIYLRYNIRPEMPQTAELMDFAPSRVYGENERLRSVRVMKSPTDYLSCESGEE